MSRKQIFQILFICLIGTMAYLKFSAASYAFMLPKASGENSTILLAQNAENQGRPWWKWWERERKSGGSRGELVNQDYCSISPSVKNTYVFSNRPLFVLFSENRSVGRIEVYSLNSQVPLWSYSISDEYDHQQQPIAIEYNGPELEAGQKYEYAIRTMDNSEPAPVDERIASFQLISNEAQIQIQTALDQINEDYTNSSHEELVWAHIDYFSGIDYSKGEITAASEDKEEGLFLDAAQQLFLLEPSLRNPHLQNIRETYCEIESEDS